MELLANYLSSRRHEVSVEVIPMWREGTLFRKVKHEAFAYVQGGRSVSADADVVYLSSPLGSLVTRRTRRAKVVAGTWTAAMFKVRGTIGKLVSHRALMPVVSTATFKVFNPWIMGRLDAVHIENPYHWPIRHPRKYYVPHPADALKFKKTRERRRTFTVLYVGRRTWEKGYDVYREAARGFARLDEEYPRYIPEEGLADAYSQAHVVVSPARLDTFGAVNLEALMCGTPVITSPLPEHLALDLPAMYAGDVRTIRIKLNRMKAVWERSESGFEERYASGLRERVAEFDTAVQLPRFEAMLGDVVASKA